MPPLVIALACLGFAGIVVGGFALGKNWVKTATGGASTWRRWLWLSLLLGVLLGAASWPLTYWMGYPIHVEAEVGRVVGFPFFVAYFDSEGRDYVGTFTMPGVIANGLFWFIVPQLVLYLLLRRSLAGNAPA